MSNYEKTCWRMINALGRIAGGGFVFVGVIFSFWGLWLVLDRKATTAVDGAPTSDPWIKAIVLVAGLVVTALGVLLLRARRSATLRLKVTKKRLWRRGHSLDHIIEQFARRMPMLREWYLAEQNARRGVRLNRSWKHTIYVSRFTFHKLGATAGTALVSACGQTIGRLRAFRR
jgi:hypothetical protein